MVWTAINSYVSAASEEGFIAGTPSSCIVRWQSGTQEYDGISWTNTNGGIEGGSRLQGDGTATDAIRAGDGTGDQRTETWDGTSWTAGNNTINAFGDPSVVGNGTTDAHIIGNLVFAFNTNRWDGTSWSGAASPVYTGRNGGAYAGVPTSGLNVCAGAAGGTSTNYDDVQSYNGATFSAESDTLDGRSRVPSASGADEDNVVLFSGRDGGGPAFKRTDSYQNGSWSSGPDQVYGHRIGQGMNNSFSSAMAGGETYDPGWFQVEQFDGPPVCWNFTAHYAGSKRLFKASGCGPFPKYLNVPGNVDKSTGRMIDDGIEIDPDEYEVI